MKELIGWIILVWVIIGIVKWIMYAQRKKEATIEKESKQQEDNFTEALLDGVKTKTPNP